MARRAARDSRRSTDNDSKGSAPGEGGVALGGARSQGRNRPIRWARSFAGQQVLTLLAVGLLIQMLLPYRHDSTAHVVAGGALILFLGSVIPPPLLNRLGSVTELALFTLVMGLAWSTETTFLGPFDLVDIAFTLGGAFVALAALSRLTAADPLDRRSTARASVVLAGAAVAYRYLLGIGPS